MGLWYTIAALPNAIEKNCKCAQTFNTLVSDLVVELAESCVIFGKNITSKSKAVATVNGYGNWTNVNGPITAPYWVIKVDENY
jgi:lipocalin